MVRRIQERLPGIQLEEKSGANPTHTSSPGAARQYQEDVADFYAVIAQAFRAAGGLDKVVARMDRRPTYASKLSEALSRTGDMRIHAEHIIAIAREPEACAHLLRFLSELSRHEPPVRMREANEDDENRAMRRRIKRWPAHLREALEKEVAEELGLRPERVKL